MSPKTPLVDRIILAHAVEAHRLARSIRSAQQPRRQSWRDARFAGFKATTTIVPRRRRWRVITRRQSARPRHRVWLAHRRRSV